MSPNKDTVGLHTFMQNRRTLFCYSGPMTEDLLTTIANPVRHQLSDKETEEAVANRVFGVFIEQAQNIIRYSHQKPNPPVTVSVLSLYLLMTTASSLRLLT